MIKRRIALIVVIVALLISGIVSADPANWGGGGRADVTRTNKITQLLTHHHAKPQSDITITLKR